MKNIKRIFYLKKYKNGAEENREAKKALTSIDSLIFQHKLNYTANS